MGNVGTKIDNAKIDEIAKRVDDKFSKSELEEWYTVFHENYPKEEYPDGMPRRQFVDENLAAHGGDEALWEYLFSRISEGEDTITFDNFIDNMALGTRGTPDEKLKWTFRFYDQDGNGFIDHDEMLTIFKSIFKMVEAVDLARTMPSDQNTPEKRVKCIFDKMDLDQDRRLSLLEFVDGCKADNAIMEVMSLLR